MVKRDGETEASDQRMPRDVTNQPTEIRITGTAMRRILVTGGAGFIGSHLVDHLMSRGDCDVTVVDNFSEFYDPAIKRANVAPYLDRRDFELFEADIVNTFAMNELFASKRFDTV